MLLQNQDAYLKAAGGVKLNEPAIDLAIAVSIASSYKEKGTQAIVVLSIEITTGKSDASMPSNNASRNLKVNFKRVFVPKNNLANSEIQQVLKLSGFRPWRNDEKVLAKNKDVR